MEVSVRCDLRTRCQTHLMSTQLGRIVRAWLGWGLIVEVLCRGTPAQAGIRSSRQSRSHRRRAEEGTNSEEDPVVNVAHGKVPGGLEEEHKAMSSVDAAGRKKGRRLERAAGSKMGPERSPVPVPFLRDVFLRHVPTVMRNRVPQ